MWAQYKKTFFWTQAFIVILCLIMLLVFRAPIQALYMPLLVMEMGAIYGARLATRVTTFVRADRLPLQSRR